MYMGKMEKGVRYLFSAALPPTSTRRTLPMTAFYHIVLEENGT